MSKYRHIVWAPQALTETGWHADVRVEIDEAGRIASVEQGMPAEGLKVSVLLPAPSNLHSHAFQRGMAGLAEHKTGADDSFWSWRDIMYRFLARLGPDDIEAIAAQAQMEMLEAGFAAVGEFHYVHHQPDGTAYLQVSELAMRVAAAAGQTGIGLAMLPVLYERGGCDDRPLTGGQKRFGNDIETFGRLIEDVANRFADSPADYSVGIAPHSLRAVRPESLDAITELLPGAQIHIHAAEQQAEVAEVTGFTGMRPVRYLLDRLAIDSSWCIVHATHMHEEETRDLAASGATVGLCPETEASLGDGIFPGSDYLRAGGRFGIGTDSNIRISLTGELRLLEYGQRLREQRRAILATDEMSSGRLLFDEAAAGGATAIGRNSGSIRTGAWADLVALEPTERWHHANRPDRVLDRFIFASAYRVADVWSAGRHVVTNGRHVERPAIEMQYAKRMKSLQEHL